MRAVLSTVRESLDWRYGTAAVPAIPQLLSTPTRIPLALLALAAPISPALAQGLLVPLTDTRTVSATSDQSSESFQAIGFGTFTRTASTISNGSGGDFASAFASITSDILPNSITIAGSAAGNGSFPSASCAQAEAIGDVTFEVPAACQYRFAGFV